MTIAISIGVNDGVVLASDSASTLMASGEAVHVYNNANKIVNLRKNLPIGFMTWGLGQLDGRSISSLAKDLRERFNGDNANPDWQIDPDSFSIKEVADRVHEFFWDELYQPEVSAARGADPPFDPGALGFMVAGYSSGSKHSEQYHFNLLPDQSADPVEVSWLPSVTWSGQPEAISRVFTGFAGDLPSLLSSELSVPIEDFNTALTNIQPALQAELVQAAMPIQDAIELAEWLVGVAIGFARFLPDHSTIGGPIEIAAISKHEGFKWIRRKHYYDTKLNP